MFMINDFYEFISRFTYTPLFSFNESTIFFPFFISFSSWFGSLIWKWNFCIVMFFDLIRATVWREELWCGDNWLCGLFDRFLSSGTFLYFDRFVRGNDLWISVSFRWFRFLVSLDGALRVKKVKLTDFSWLLKLTHFS